MLIFLSESLDLLKSFGFLALELLVLALDVTNSTCDHTLVFLSLFLRIDLWCFVSHY